jgi:hypothetical protein
VVDRDGAGKPYRAIANNYKNISTGILFNKFVIEKRSHLLALKVLVQTSAVGAAKSEDGRRIQSLAGNFGF